MSAAVGAGAPDTADRWASLHAAFVEAAAGAAWVQHRRRAAMARFTTLGWPTQRQEAWKYTNLRTLRDGDFELAMAAPNMEATLPVGLGEGPRLVFVNGHCNAALSCLPADLGVRLRPLGDLLHARDAAALDATASWGAAAALPSLGEAFLLDGAVVEFLPNAQVHTPIELIFAGVGATRPWMTHPKVVVLAGRGSRGTLVVRHVDSSSAASFTNLTCEILLQDNAALEHVVLGDESHAANRVSHTTARLGRDARLRCVALTAGGALCRQDLHVTLSQPGATCTLSGLSLGSGQQHQDAQVCVEHAAPHGTSTQLFKTVLDGHATGVFGGVVRVAPGALKTDARQLSRNLLLSARATVHTRPQLEILADDVKCSHGATVGQLDEEAAFYLRSRGIDAATTRRLLTYAFASDVLRHIEHPGARQLCDARLRTHLGLQALGESLQ